MLSDWCSFHDSNLLAEHTFYARGRQPKHMCLCDVQVCQTYLFYYTAYATIALFPDTATGPSMNWPQLPLRVLSSIIIFYYFIIFSYYTYLRYIWVFESLHRYRTSCSRAASLGDLWLFIGYFRSNISCSIRECIRIEFIAVQGNKKECDVGTFVSGARHQELGTKRRGWNDWINICYHSSFTFQIYVTINQLYLSR